MTWFNRATLRARWAAPEDVSRELDWVVLGPASAAERDAFAVPPGESTATYAGGLPTGVGDSRYAVFSAEVGMGKLGHVANLVETTGSTCIASNADPSPKWIEQAIYAEDDAPILDASSALELECRYRNGGEDSVLWGAEGEATVWGRKERCSAVVFYYPLPLGALCCAVIEGLWGASKVRGCHFVEAASYQFSPGSEVWLGCMGRSSTI